MLNTDSKWRDLVASARISVTTATTWTRTMRTIWCTLSQAGAIETKRIKILSRCGFNFLESFLLLKNQVVDLSLSRVSRSSPSTRETSFSGKQRTILFCWKKVIFPVFSGMSKTSGSFTPPLPRALSNTLMKISKSPQSPQSPQGERKKKNFFQRHLPGGAADADQREGKGSPLSSPQVPTPFLF